MNIRPSELRILQAIMAICDRGDYPTVRSINNVLGTTGSSYIPKCLRRLKTHGLVTFETDRNRILVGTIRPAVRFIRVEELASA